MGGRLRQYNAGRYKSSEAVNAEFENLVRYINSAELGNQTIKELLLKLFTEDGDVALGIKFRYDAIAGLQVAVGDDSEDWTTVVGADDIRGAPGISLGFIDGPVYFNRVDIVATASQTVFPYSIASEAADVLVFVGGLLQAASAYTYSQALNTVTLSAPQSAGTKVVIYSVRNNSSSTYRRTEFLAASAQVIFPFPHTEFEYVQVFRNGILQREGASYDYIKSHVTGTITMTVPQAANDLITALVVQNDAIRGVLGLMLEDNYATNGLIRFDRISIADGAIAQAKTAGLPAALDLKGDVYVGTSAPGSPRAGSLWINTAGAVPTLLFYDGARFLNASPEGLLPDIAPADALKFLRLNSTASGYELATVDLSGVVPAEDVGAANGVASLDGSARLPVAQMPTIHRKPSLLGILQGSVTNGTKLAGIIGGQKYSLDAADYVLGAGSATVQLRIGGVDFGLPVAVTTTPVRQTWGAVVANAVSAGLAVQLVVTLASGASDLAWSISGERVA